MTLRPLSLFIFPSSTIASCNHDVIILLTYPLSHVYRLLAHLRFIDPPPSRRVHRLPRTSPSAYGQRELVRDEPKEAVLEEVEEDIKCSDTGNELLRSTLIWGSRDTERTLIETKGSSLPLFLHPQLYRLLRLAHLTNFNMFRPDGYNFCLD